MDFDTFDPLPYFLKCYPALVSMVLPTVGSPPTCLIILSEFHFVGHPLLFFLKVSLEAPSLPPTLLILFLGVPSHKYVFSNHAYADNSESISGVVSCLPSSVLSLSS